MLAERLEYVDTRKEKIISLVFEAIGSLKCRKCPAQPFLACFRFLTYCAELAIKKSNASFHRQGFTSNSIVARAHKRGFTTGYLQTRTLNISTPAVTSFFGKDNWFLNDTPWLIIFYIENISLVEPDSVYIVVHLITKPRRCKYLSTRLCSLGLMFLFLGNTRLDNARGEAGDLIDSNLVVTHISLAERFIFVVCPDNITTGGAILKKCL